MIHKSPVYYNEKERSMQFLTYDFDTKYSSMLKNKCKIKPTYKFYIEKLNFLFILKDTSKIECKIAYC